MPVAEPSGEHSVKIFLDLSPFYGKIEDERTVKIIRPPADILEQRLAELKSEDPQVRRTAALDLAYFQDAGDRVFPALTACLQDPEEQVRTYAVYSMGRYPKQVEKKADVFLEILRDESFSKNLKARCALLLGRYGPLTGEVEKALEKAGEAFRGDRSALTVEYALKRFEARKKEASEKTKTP